MKSYYVSLFRRWSPQRRQWTTMTDVTEERPVFRSMDVLSDAVRGVWSVDAPSRAAALAVTMDYLHSDEQRRKAMTVYEVDLGP